MENLIRNLSAVKECHDKTSAEQMMQMSSDELKHHCIKEKIDFINSLKMADTKAIIRERIEIKKIKDSEKVQKRREFLDAYFK
jgi:hypothetical protein